jgi:enoyl-CoA hydratase
MSEPVVLTEIDEGIATIRLNRPPMNPLNIELIEAAREAIANVDADGDIKGVILTGMGSCFCSGVDIREVPQYTPEEMHRMIMGINRLCLTAYGLLKPLVTAVDGHAIGGGLVLSMMGDLRIVTDADCNLGLAEVKAGIPFPACPLQIMKAEMRPEVRRRMSLTGESVSPETALAWGLFDEKIEATRLLEMAREKVKSLMAHPPASYRVIKNQIRVTTIVRMADIVEREADPMLQQWI